MVVPARQPFYARGGNGPDRADDPHPAPCRATGRYAAYAAGLILLLLAALPAAAERLRLALYTVELGRAGPGLLLRDIGRGDPAIEAVTATIATAAPDAIVLVGFDYDYELAALSALAARLAERGAVYPYRFAYPPNAGVATGFDLDGDGRLGGPGDAQGWGRFAGAGGLALLSRLPVLAGQSRDLSPFLWRDLPGGSLAALTAAGALPAAAAPVLRLSTVAAWDVALDSPAGPLHLLTFAAGPPVFDGPEDRNGRRNADELGFWAALLDGRLKIPPPAGPIVLLGDANLDPDAGAGRRSAIRALLAHPRLQDPLAGAGPTVDWPPPKGPGKLRVDYILPGAGLRVTDAGIAPADGGSRHRLLWLDLELR